MLAAHRVVDFALVAVVGTVFDVLVLLAVVDIGVDMTVLLGVLAHKVVVDIVVRMLLLVEYKLVVVAEHRPVVVVVDYIALFVFCHYL